MERELELLESLQRDLSSYRIALAEIIDAEHEKEKAIENLSEVKEEVANYLLAGKLLYDTSSNYIDLKWIVNSEGKLLEMEKHYDIKADETIKENEDILNDDTVYHGSEEYLDIVREELDRCKSNDIFTELQSIEEVLSKLDTSSNYFKENVKTLLENLRGFNILDEASKMEGFDSFCIENLDSLNGSKNLMKFYNTCNGVNSVYYGIIYEYVPLFSRIDEEEFKVLLKWDAECYSRIKEELEYLGEVSKAKYDFNLVKKQIKCVEDLQSYVDGVVKSF